MKNIAAIILCAAAVSLGAASPSFAQTFDATQPAGASAAQSAPGAMPPRGPHGFAALNLTDAQKAQLASIESDTRAKVTAVLTPDQQTQLNAALANPAPNAGANAAPGSPGRGHAHGMMRALRGLNLTDAQRAQIRTIMHSQHQAMLAVLTPDQQAQLKAMAHRAPGGAKPQ